MTLPIRGDARKSGKCGAANRHLALRWNIEGEQITTAGIALRIGTSEYVAHSRLKREQAKPGPVTWAGLAIISNKKDGA